MTLDYSQFTEYLKNPLVCASIIAVITYYIYSYNYITKHNVRTNFPLKCQRTSNLKSMLYVFFVAVLVLLMFKYVNTLDNTQRGGSMLQGQPPF